MRARAGSAAVSRIVLRFLPGAPSNIMPAEGFTSRIRNLLRSPASRRKDRRESLSSKVKQASISAERAIYSKNSVNFRKKNNKKANGPEAHKLRLIKLLPLLKACDTRVLLKF